MLFRSDFAGNAVEVKVTGTYDVNVPGEYTITYKAVDKYGTESAEMKTILKVVEKSNNNETPDNNGNGSGNGGTDSGNNGSDSENGGNDSGNNGSTTAGNNNSTSNNAGGTNTNPSKIPTTGAAVSNYVIGGIGAIVSIIGAYLFKKKK